MRDVDEKDLIRDGKACKRNPKVTSSDSRRLILSEAAKFSDSEGASVRTRLSPPVTVIRTEVTVSVKARLSAGSTSRYAFVPGPRSRLGHDEGY
jgi:hypothetical protein